MPYTDALTWLTQRQQLHQDALPDSLAQYRSLDLQPIPGRSELIDDRAIAQSMRIILATRPGEVPQRLDFGSRLPFLIDEPLTEVTRAAAIRESVTAIKRWEPRANVIEVAIDQDSVSGRIAIEIKWQPANRADLTFAFSVSF